MRQPSKALFICIVFILETIIGCGTPSFTLPKEDAIAHSTRDSGVPISDSDIPFVSEDVSVDIPDISETAIAIQARIVGIANQEERSNPQHNTGTDRDEDGVEDNQDNCPDRYNPNQEDLDEDTVGDICDLRPETLGPGHCQDIDGLLNEDVYVWCQEDEDDDTVPNYSDLCYWVADEVSEDGIPVDSDEDLVPDACDRCPNRQAVPFADFLGEDQTIADSDEDGVDTSCDNCPEDSNTDQQDLDEDGVGDICDHFPEEWGHKQCDRITGEQQTRADSAWCGQDADGDGVPNGGDREPENADVQ